MRAAFYCVADERYFLGAVAVLNSLRLHGHREPLYVCDVGLTERQRALLAASATVVPAPPGRAPWLAKTVAPLLHPAPVMVLIDTDMLVTRSLAELVDGAGDGVIAARNDRPRHVDAWGELLDLPRPREQEYVSSGLVVLGGSTGTRVLELLDDRQGRVDLDRTLFGRAQADYPFLYPEQDVLNAILAGPIERERLRVLDARLAPYPPFAGLRLTDLDRAECAYRDGERPFVLHHFGRKPWLEPIYHGLYSRLMARLLLGDDVALRAPEDLVPLRMRSGLRARVARARADVVDVTRRRVLQRSERG